MSAGKSDKPPRIKGLVKRCRSFKEDIISRLARNRSLGTDGNSPGIPTSWNSDGDNPGDIPAVEPHVSISHRLKEANLTIQFVESLIQKNCIDLLGGSSNVMLDLMGCLLNDVKKASASDSAPYQSAISQVKTAISDFLTSVDIILYDSGECEDERELYFQKLLETLKTTRDALKHLKNLIDAKENGGGSGKIGLTTPKKTLSPTGKEKSLTNILSPNQTNVGREKKWDHESCSTVTKTEERPPLPPKLKQWTAKSFDTIDWSPSGKRGDALVDNNSSNSHLYQITGGHHHHHNLNNNNSSTSLLSQWLEQSSLSTKSGTTSSSSFIHNNNNSSSSCSSSQQHLSVHRSSTSFQPGIDMTGGSSGGGGSYHQYQQQQLHHHQSSKFLELSSTSSLHSQQHQHQQSQNWVDSSVYVGRSSTSSASACGTTNTSSSTSKILQQLNGKKTRTLSDSYRLGSDESLDKMLLVDDSSRSQSAATTHSQSLSLGSSLDNLLLVDSQSQQSGLSPNSNCGGGGGGTNRISVSSCNSGSCNVNSGHSHSEHLGLAGLSNYDPENDVDADVFLAEVKTRRSRENLHSSNPGGGMMRGEGEDEYEEPPPRLPEKQSKIRHFLLGSNFSTTNPTTAVSPTHSGGCNAQCNSNVNNPRCPSPYDNVHEGEEIDLTWHGDFQRHNSTAGFQQHLQQRQFMSYSESRNTLVGASMGFDSDEKPPLPPKKKHSLITAYVELMHNFDSHNSHSHNHHHHHHFHNHQNSLHYQHGSSSTSSTSQHPQLSHQHSHQAPLQSYSYSTTGGNNPHSESYNNLIVSSPGGTEEGGGSGMGGGMETIPGLTSGEIKRASYAQSSSYHHFLSCTSGAGGGGGLYAGIITSPTSSDKDNNDDNSFDNHRLLHLTNSSISPSPSSGSNLLLGPNKAPPPALPPKKSRGFLRNSVSEQGDQGALSLISPSRPQNLSPPTSLTLNTLTVPPGGGGGGGPPITPAHSFSGVHEEDALDEENGDLYILDASPLLIMNDGSTTNSKATCDGPEVKGGEPHVLIVYAASPNLTDMKFREVFLLTYRTYFVRPLDVVTKVWKRYQYFEKKTDRSSVVHARATLDLFVDVVNSLTPMDLDEDMLLKVRNCIYYLVNNGEILSALKARKGLIVKYGVRRRLLCPKPIPASLAVTAESQSLLHWSATSIAQQMTLLDAELFRQLEPAELLLWAREQSEDFCALNNFTEHFNKVSYWARSKVLTCLTSRERNRTMKKLIESMKRLREYNNFNSLLAVLAALDSAPIRRLGFSRRLTEALKPHAALTDSSGSFRTYRQALAESKPPCIPYIGLVLQDLTFVHIGNADFLPDGKVNYVKRWQQYVVLEPIRRFHSCDYSTLTSWKRDETLLTFLNNFDESLNDDDLWALSEQIKPVNRSKN